MKKFYTHFFAFTIVFALGVSLVGAQGGGNTVGGSSGGNTVGGSGPSTNISTSIPNPFNCGGAGGGCNLITFINVIVDRVVLPIGGIVAVLAFIWSGFMFVTAQGDEKKIGEARTALLYTAVGTAILLGARVLTEVLENTINSVRAS